MKLKNKRCECVLIWGALRALLTCCMAVPSQARHRRTHRSICFNRARGWQRCSGYQNTGHPNARWLRISPQRHKDVDIQWRHCGCVHSICSNPHARRQRQDHCIHCRASVRRHLHRQTRDKAWHSCTFGMCARVLFVRVCCLSGVTFGVTGKQHCGSHIR